LLTVILARDYFVFDVSAGGVEVDAQGAGEHGAESVVVAAYKDSLNYCYR
jgi:hypothetical protein